MLAEMYTIEISANTVAWYGALVATFSFIFSAYNILRDRPSIKIKCQKDMKIVGSQSIYDPNEIYFSVTVINTGRRPIRITKAGFRVLGEKKRHALFSDSFLKTRNEILTEENPATQFMVKQNEEELKRIWYLWAIDAVGKMYKRYLHPLPTFWRIWYWIRYQK